MRVRTLAAISLALPAVATAQTSAALASPAQSPSIRQLSAEPVTSQVRYAGTYRVATGTWVRGRRTRSAAGSTDILYSNTAASGYYTALIGPAGSGAGGLLVDEGRVPSLSDPAVFALGGPGRNVSRVTGVQIGYCDFDATNGVSGWELSFYSSYDPCTYPPDPAQLAGVATVMNAPSNGCWIVDLDLSGSPFLLPHDGDGIYAGGGPGDTFGVSWRYTGAGIGNAGPIITGDPDVTDTGYAMTGDLTGSNTYFGEVGGCPGTGTGYGNRDAFWFEDVQGAGSIVSGCSAFNGYQNTGTSCGGPITWPWAGFWLEVRGEDAIDPSVVSQPGCVGAVSAVTGVAGKLEAIGSADTITDQVRLRAFDLPPYEFGVFAAGRTPLPAMTLPSGNGWVCIDPATMGGIGRLLDRPIFRSTGPTGEMHLDTILAEWTTSLLPDSVGFYSAMAGATTHFQAWHRENGVGLGFNFTGSCAVTWQ